MSNPQQMPQLITPTTKPSQPTTNPPALNLPPSLPKQSYLNDCGLNSDNNTTPQQFDGNPSSLRRGSTYGQDAPIARSLTNNDHNIIPASMGNTGGIKMGQSPTILSILSGTDQTTNNGLSYRGGGSMVASSRTYVSTTVPQQNFSPQQPSNQQAIYHQPLPLIRLGQNNIQDEDEDDISEIDDFSQDELPFDFTLEE